MGSNFSQLWRMGRKGKAGEECREGEFEKRRGNGVEFREKDMIKRDV